MNIRDVKECPDCASMNILVDDYREQLICRDCGLIFEPLAPMNPKKIEMQKKPPAKKPTKNPAKKTKAKKKTAAKNTVMKKPVKKSAKKTVKKKK